MDLNAAPHSATLKAAAQLAKQRLAARGFSLSPRGQDVDALADAARKEAATRMGVRAIELAAQGGFADYAKQHLKIKDNRGMIVPFHLNDPQAELHKVVVEQMQALGRIRIIVLKARQLGISTYITGRAYYKLSRRTGQSGIIIAHENDASENIHKMVRTYHDFMDPRFRPATRRASADEILFHWMRSSMRIATARNVQSGRSFTQQFVHASEVAFWPSASQITAGAMQGIHDVDHTEVWFESTARGPIGEFYKACQAARKGELGDYRFVFLPWFLLPERVRTPPDDFEEQMSGEDRDYMLLHALTLPQMAWRENKTRELRGLSGSDPETARITFGQEYPAVPEDAFNAQAVGSFIPVSSVVRARRAMRDGLVPANETAPKILGIDPSWIGNDKFTVWERQGRRARRVDMWKHHTITQSVARLLTIFEQVQPDYACVDAVGIGAGVYDLLVEVLESKSIRGIVFCIMAGATSEDEERYVLVRDHCWGRLKDWLANPPQVAIEDDDAIQADLTSVRNKGDVHRRVRLMSKDEMRKPPLSLPSPDDGDALSLTFALSDVGTIGRAGTRGGGTPNPNRPFNYRIGASS